MNAYLWSYTSPVSLNWHEGGAVLIIADNINVARRLWNLHEEHGNDHTALTGHPDRIWNVSDNSQREVLVFEDAGCC